MPIPEPPVDFSTYNETLATYNGAATELDAANAARNGAFADLQSAQAAYDAANDAQEAATNVASEAFGAHTAAAEDIGVTPAAGPPVATPYRR